MRIPIAILALAALSLACKSSGGQGQTSVSEAFRQAALPAAEAALLTADDFPGDWTSEPPDEDDDFDVKLEGECADLNIEEFPGQIAEAESDEFKSPLEDSVQSFSVVFVGDGAAADAMATMDALDECGDDLAEAISQRLLEVAAEEAGSDLEKIEDSVRIDTAFEAVEPFDLSADSSAWGLRFEMDLAGLRFLVTSHFFLERYGGMIGGIVYTTLGDQEPPRQESSELMRVMFERMEEAYDSLPE